MATGMDVDALYPPGRHNVRMEDCDSSKPAHLAIGNCGLTSSSSSGLLASTSMLQTGTAQPTCSCLVKRPGRTEMAEL